MVTSFPEPSLAFKQKVYSELAEAEKRAREIVAEVVAQYASHIEEDRIVPAPKYDEPIKDRPPSFGKPCKGGCGGIVLGYKGMIGWCTANGCRAKEIARRRADGSWKGAKTKEELAVVAQNGTSELHRLLEALESATAKVEELKQAFVDASRRQDQALEALQEAVAKYGQ